MSNINDYGFPFSNVSDDRLYGAADWRAYFGSLVSNGVVEGLTNQLEVTESATPAKSVLVNTGTVFLEGVIRIIDTAETITIDENTSGNPRIDRIVARLTYANREITLEVLKGTAAASPTAPTLTQSSAVWEISLAQIALANGYSTITDSEITDERTDESVCGFAKSIYMKEFDDENNLLKYDRNVTTVDSDGNPTVIEYDRPSDSTLFLQRTYSNADSNGYYQTCTELFYESDGTTVYKTIVYTFTFFSNGIIDTSTRTVTL